MKEPVKFANDDVTIEFTSHGVSARLGNFWPTRTVTLKNPLAQKFIASGVAKLAGKKSDTEAAAPVDDEKAFASSAAERLAEKYGLKAEFIKGTGTDGKITKPDVEAAIEDQAKELAAFAEKWGIDLNSIEGTGPDDTHTQENLDNALVLDLVDAYDVSIDDVKGTGTDGIVRPVDVLQHLGLTQENEAEIIAKLKEAGEESAEADK